MLQEAHGCSVSPSELRRPSYEDEGCTYAPWRRQRACRPEASGRCSCGQQPRRKPAGGGRRRLVGGSTGRAVPGTDSRDSQVREIAPLDVVVDDPYLLWVFDGQALAAVHSKGVAKSPVLPPFAIEDLLCCLYGHLHHIVQNEFLLGHVWVRDRHKDVLETSVPRPVEKRDWFVREGFFVVLEQKLLGLVAWGLASDEDQVAGMPNVNKVGPAAVLALDLSGCSLIARLRAKSLSHLLRWSTVISS